MRTSEAARRLTSYVHVLFWQESLQLRVRIGLPDQLGVLVLGAGRRGRRQLPRCSGEEEKQERGRGRQAGPKARAPPSVSPDVPHHSFDENLIGERPSFQVGGASQILPGQSEPSLGAAGGAGEEMPLLARGCGARAERFLKPGAIAHRDPPKNLARSLLRARCIRTRTPVTVMSNRRAMILSGSPSTSRARRISRSS